MSKQQLGMELNFNLYLRRFSIKNDDCSWVQSWKTRWKMSCDALAVWEFCRLENPPICTGDSLYLWRLIYRRCQWCQMGKFSLIIATSNQGNSFESSFVWNYLKKEKFHFTFFDFFFMLLLLLFHSAIDEESWNEKKIESHKEIRRKSRR